MQRPAGRVSAERLEVERLGDHALAGERRVAVDQDRERDLRVVVAPARRAVGLLASREALDDRVDRFEVARVGRERDGDVACGALAPALGAKVVLDVSARARRLIGDGGEVPLALELAQNHLVRPADEVGQHVQAAAVGHAGDDLVCSVLRGQLEREVEHRNHHVEPFDRELLLPEERLAEVALESLHLGEAREEPALVVRLQRLAVGGGLDRLPQPDPLLVVGDVLDLVGAGAAVDLLKLRKDVRQRLARHVNAEQARRDLFLDLGRQRRDQPLGLQGGIADRLGAERIEARGEVAVCPVRLHERHRGRNGGEERLVDRRGWRRRRLGRGGRRGRGGFGLRAVAVRLEHLEQARDAGMLPQQGAVTLEELAPLSGHGLGILEVLLENGARVSGVEPVDLSHDASQFFVAGCFPLRRFALPERPARDHADDHPDQPPGGGDGDSGRREVSVPAAGHGCRYQADQERRKPDRDRALGDRDEAAEDGERGEEAGDGLRRALAFGDRRCRAHRTATLSGLRAGPPRP